MSIIARIMLLAALLAAVEPGNAQVAAAEAGLRDLTAEEKAWLSQEHTVRVRIAPAPPHVFLDGAEPRGISIEYLNRIAERTEIRFIAFNEPYGYVNALNSIQRLEGPDMMLITVANPDRKLEFSQPYCVSPIVIFTQTSSDFIARLEDLDGKTVGMQSGVASHLKPDERYPMLRTRVFDHDVQGLMAVSTGELDAYVGILTTATHEIRAHGLTNLKVAAPSPLPDVGFSFGIRADWPELRSIIDKVLDSMPPGEHAAIQARYVAMSYEHGVTFLDVLKWTMLVAAIGFLGVLLVLYWNRQLARRAREIESRYRDLVEQSPVVFELYDRSGTLREVNDAFEELWDLSKDKVIGKFNIYESEQVRALGFLPYFEQAYAGQRSVVPDKEFDASKEEVAARGGGRKRWVSTILYPVRNVAGEVTHVVLMHEDITERKQIEDEMRQQRTRLRALASELTIAEERERRRLAGELHDHVGQMLALARVQLSTAPKEESDAQQAFRMKEASKTILEASRETRRLVSDLSSPSLSALGLSAAISDWISEEIADKCGVSVDLVDNVDPARLMLLGDDASIILYRNVRELLTNVVKHANATTVTVCLDDDDDRVRIVVQDDGDGMELHRTESRVTSNGGFGLFSIQERMTDLCGTMDVTSAPGKGCTVELVLPLNGTDRSQSCQTHTAQP